MSSAADEPLQPGGVVSSTMVDGLDTAYLMGRRAEFDRAVAWLMPTFDLTSLIG